MWNSLFTVAYMPHFSEDFLLWIRKNVTPSLVNRDKDSSSQFNVGAINSTIEDLEYTPSDEDQIILKALDEQDVDYVELDTDE